MWYTILLQKENINAHVKQSKQISKLLMLDNLKNLKILSQSNKDQNIDIKKDITRPIS